MGRHTEPLLVRQGFPEHVLFAVPVLRVLGFDLPSQVIPKRRAEELHHLGGPTDRRAERSLGLHLYLGRVSGLCAVRRDDHGALVLQVDIFPVHVLVVIEQSRQVAVPRHSVWMEAGVFLQEFSGVASFAALEKPLTDRHALLKIGRAFVVGCHVPGLEVGGPTGCPPTVKK